MGHVASIGDVAQVRRDAVATSGQSNLRVRSARAVQFLEPNDSIFEGRL
jgi:hypothetical protein